MFADGVFIVIYYKGLRYLPLIEKQGPASASGSVILILLLPIQTQHFERQDQAGTSIEQQFCHFKDTARVELMREDAVPLFSLPSAEANNDKRLFTREEAVAARRSKSTISPRLH